MNTLLNPKRTVAELKELRALTENENGAQRVAFTKTWILARKWLTEKLAAFPVETHLDAAGNLWTTLRGESEKALLIGGHIDSVPNGGWLDGCLNFIAGVEVLRRINAQYKGKPPVTIRLVDWADEEGARFGRSLFGSSSCAGTLDPDEVRDLRDRDGERLEDVLARYDVELDRARESGARLRGARAYIEAHIEQGPVLESKGEPAATVLGTCGVERHVAVFTGETAHAGATPMGMRRDTFMATSQAALQIREVGIRHQGVCTVGRASSEPG